MIKNFTLSSRMLSGTKILALSAGLLLSVMATAPDVQAQMVPYTENFTVAGPYPQLILPRGWSQGKYGVSFASNNQFDIIQNGVNPGATPPSLLNMLQYGSDQIPNAEASFVASKRLDMRNIPVAGAPFSFRFHRDAAAGADRIEVYLNDSAIVDIGNPSQTLLAENNTGATVIHRSTGLAPASLPASWNQLQYTIPNTFNSANVYVIIVAYSANGNNMYFDDFNVETYPAGQQLVTGVGQLSANHTSGTNTLQINAAHIHNFPVGATFLTPGAIAGRTIVSVAGNVVTLSSNSSGGLSAGNTVTTNPTFGVVSQNTATTAPGQNDQQIIGVKITMDGALNPRFLQQMTFNTNGSTNPPSDIANAKLYTTGSSSSWSLANAQLLGTVANPWLTNYTFWPAPGASTGFLEHGDNYLWIVYDILGGAVPGNVVDAEWVEMRMNVNANFGTQQAGYSAFTATINPPTLNGNRLIDVVYCIPSYTVGTAWAGYTNNDYINGVRLTGDNAPGIGTIGGAGPNPRNRVTGPAGPNCAGGTPANPILCAFQKHPDSYENFPETGYSTAPIVTETAATLTIFDDRVSSPTYPTAYTQNGYPFQLQVGDWGSSNGIAAWIDYNGDGIFNNYFDNIRKTANATNGSTTLNLATATYQQSTNRNYGLNVGMTVYGPGIPLGTTVVVVGATSVTLSAAATVTTTGGTFEFVNETAPNNRGEKVAQSGPLNEWQIFVGEIKVPSWVNSFAGKRRFRVREVYASYSIHPCNTYTWGETEDYTVTLRPSCPAYTGPDGPYKTWLGFTDDWNDPANWCPEGAPINGAPVTSLRFPGGPTGGAYAYTKAKLPSGTLARAKKFRIEVGDTVEINAPAASDLIVTDSLVIQTPTSALKVITNKVDTMQAYNGVLYPNPVLPSFWNNENLIHLRINNKTRSRWAYNAAEFAAFGAMDGDVIDTIRIHIQRRSNGNVYKNFKIRYYFIAATSSFNAANANPAVSGAPAVPIEVFSGNVDVSSIPLGGYGTITLPLTNGGIVLYPQTSNRRLVIDMSYDQLGSGLTGTSCCAYTAALAPSVPENDLMWFTQTNANYLYHTWSSDTYAGTAETMLPNQAITYNVRLNSNLRPNLTFSIKRPYIKFPITLNGTSTSVHWVNNGDFIPGNSLVTFSATANQRIEGTSVTNFNEITINNLAHVTMLTDVNVLDTISLSSGRLKLNNKMLTLQNPLKGALNRVGGFLQADPDLAGNNISPYSRVKWQMGAATDMRILPFVTAGGQYLPLTYRPLTGDHNVTFSTYPTQPDNTNLPSPTVTQIYGFNGSSWGADGSVLVDRYYLLDNILNPTSTASVTFSYYAAGGGAGTERASTNLTGAGAMRAQRWLNDSIKWEQFPFFHPTQIYHTAGAAAPVDSVTVTNFSYFPLSSWWVIAGQSTPLPVTLLDFVAEPYKDKVKLKWSTSAELNASHYIVERTTDNESFSFIGQVAANGTTSSRTDYNAWDMNPVQGIQYYYLRQYDRDGKMETYGPVSAKFTSEVFDIVTATVSSSEMGLTVVFNYDTDEPVSYRVLDMTGRVVASKNRIAATPGLNVIDIDAKLAQGAYQISIMNSEKTVSRKFFY